MASKFLVKDRQKFCHRTIFRHAKWSNWIEQRAMTRAVIPERRPKALDWRVISIHDITLHHTSYLIRLIGILFQSNRQSFRQRFINWWYQYCLFVKLNFSSNSLNSTVVNNYFITKLSISYVSNFDHEFPVQGHTSRQIVVELDLGIYLIRFYQD